MTIPPSPHPPSTTTQLRIPGVRLLQVIGRGGFATVYGGIQESMDRPVAVKVDSRPLSDERNRRRYLREVQAAGRITGHPHVVSLIDTGVLPDDRPFIVMERCDGGSLVDLVARGPVSPADAVSLVRAVSSALGAAHEAGVLHRDVKPANILLDSYGSPRLTDFGIAAVEREGQDPTVTLECLTPDYASPEAFALSVPGPSGDVWSMGAVLYFLLTGRGPRRRKDGSVRSLPEIVRTLDEPVSLDDDRVPEPLRPLLARAMHRDPLARFRDGAALARALAEVQDALGAPDLTVTGPEVALRLTEAGLRSSGASAPSSASAPSGSGVPLVHGSGNLRPVTGAPLRPAPSQGPAAPARPAIGHGTLVGLGAVCLAVGLLLGFVTGWGAAAWRSQPAGSPATVGTPAQPGAGDTTGPAASAPPFEVGTCLGGIVTISGVSTAQKTDCAATHFWEVFAVGTLEASTAGHTRDELLADPQVIATCTTQTAVAYGAQDVEITVLGPSEVQWAAGSRGFSCAASPLSGSGTTGSFRQG